MKKLLALFLALTMVLAVTVAAGADDEHEPVTIEYLTGSDSTGFLDQTIVDFEAAYPWITVNCNTISGNTDDIKQALITSMVAGDSNPDVFRTDVVWTGQFAQAGWIKDVTGEFDTSIHSAGSLESCMYDGKYYAMPEYTDTQLLVYRKDIISEDELPKTWDDMLALCEKYVGKGGIDYGWLWQGAQAEALVCNAVSFFGSNGAGFVEDGNIVCNSPAAVEALQFMYDLIYKYGYSPEDVLSHVPSDTTPIFEQGSSLFCTVWPGNYAAMLVEDTSKVKDCIGITTMPVGPSGTQPASCTGGWNVAVSAFSDQPEAATLFAQYLTSEENEKLNVQMTGSLPTIMSLYNDASLQESVPYLGAVKNSALPTARPAPRPPITQA